MAYIRSGGVIATNPPASDMDQMLNKKLGTNIHYPPSTWLQNINLLGKLPEKTASGAIAHFTDGADTVPFKSSKFYITPTQASGTPTPSNPLPITGWTGANVVHTGANLVDIAGRTITSQTTVMSATTFKAGTYILSAHVKNNGTIRGNIRVAKGGSTIAEIQCLQGEDERKNSSPFTLTEDTQITILCNGQSAGYNFTFSDLQLEVGSTATTYAPYTATTYPVSWSEQGTVYGGYFKDGELWKTLHKVTPNEDFTFVIDSQTSSICTIYFAFAINNLPTGKNGGVCVSNMFSKTIPSGTAGRMVLTGNQIYMVLPKSDSSTWTTTEVKQWFEDNPTDICYELATPVKVADIDPLEIVSMLGVNNIWSDTGDCEIEYRADTDLLITELGG